jgi:hypothetical protein
MRAPRPFHSRLSPGRSESGGTAVSAMPHQGNWAGQSTHLERMVETLSHSKGQDIECRGLGR